MARKSKVLSPSARGAPLAKGLSFFRIGMMRFYVLSAINGWTLAAMIRIVIIAPIGPQRR
jgi:hypothetical protein